MSSGLKYDLDAWKKCLYKVRVVKINTGIKRSESSWLPLEVWGLAHRET
jgi:hypothetical protein